MSRHFLFMGLLLATPGVWGQSPDATVQDFDAPGTPYVTPQYGCDPEVEIVPGGPTGNFARIASSAPACFPHTNGMDFDRAASGARDLLVATFDFRIAPPLGSDPADGLGVAFLDTFFYGDSGEAPGLAEEDNAEEPNFFGSLGVGFDLWEPGGLGENHVSIHFDRVLVAEEVLTDVSLAGGEWLGARIVANLASGLVSVEITAEDGSSEKVFDHLPVPGLSPYEARVHVGARCGGLTADHEVDNILVETTSSPYLSVGGACPGTVDLSVFGATPGAALLVLSAATEGSFTVPPGLPCEGTELGLANPKRRATVTTDANGEIDLERAVPEPACGLFLQVVDSSTCEVSNVARFPVVASLGEWSEVIPFPVVPIHAHLLPDGRVLFWDRHGPGWDGDPYLWDPVSGAFSQPPGVEHDIFCAGFSFLGDGRLLVTGGHIDDEVGAPEATLFDPFTNSWQPIDDMNGGRWYPTNTTLADGSVLVLAGTMQPGVTNPLPQVFEPELSVWRDLTSAQHPGYPQWPDFYPFSFLAPDGRVFVAGPQQMARSLDTAGSGSWSEIDASSLSYRDYGTAALFEEGKVLMLGGNPREPDALPSAVAEVIDLLQPEPEWRSVAPMPIGRRHADSTLLPDGKVLVTGGSSAAGFDEPAGATRQALLWDPVTEAWTELAPQVQYRGYHSIALLLPDGRVLSAGGGHPGAVDYPDGEIFSPPYLFRGPRPAVTAAPEAVGYGDAFVVETPDGGAITAVHWLRLGAVTHSFNQNQRIVRLEFAPHPLGIEAVAPADPTLAPPGHYLQFLLNDEGIPSVATTIQIGSKPASP